jgi:predicted Ser/Thr protein kinase
VTEQTGQSLQQEVLPKPSFQVEQALLLMGVRFNDFRQAVDNVILTQAKEIEALKAQLAKLDQTT